VHSDFSRSPSTGRYRRVNVLTYLNHDWTDPGGHLELWADDGPTVSVAPEFGTTVAFITSATSWHGHPKPADRWRASLAAYFFTDDPPPDFREQSTVWHPKRGGRA
jgi:Rps23 Pro-64 3,4-dihydroxylase Tpa1-like proline 4-hydroxylase